MENKLSVYSQGRLRRVVSYVEDLWAAGDVNNPFFTLHGPHHLRRVEQNALALLIPIQEKSPLEDDQLFLLLAAVWLHDVGMILRASDKEERQARSEHTRLPDWIRKNHHRRSSAFIRNTSEPLGLSEAEAGYVAVIAELHRGTDLRASILLDEAYPDTRFLAAVLRLADELDVTCARTPDALLKEHWPRLDARSRWHWAKHWCVLSLVFRYAKLSHDTHTRIEFEAGLRLPRRELRDPLWEAVVAPVRRVLEEEGADFILLKRGLVVDLQRVTYSVQEADRRFSGGGRVSDVLEKELGGAGRAAVRSSSSVLGQRCAPGARAVVSQAFRCLLPLRDSRILAARVEEVLASAIMRLGAVKSVAEVENWRTTTEDLLTAAFVELGSADASERVARTHCRAFVDLGWRVGKLIHGGVAVRRSQISHLAASHGNSRVLRWVARNDSSELVRREAALGSKVHRRRYRRLRVR